MSTITQQVPARARAESDPSPINSAIAFSEMSSKDHTVSRPPSHTGIPDRPQSTRSMHTTDPRSFYKIVAVGLAIILLFFGSAVTNVCNGPFADQYTKCSRNSIIDSASIADRTNIQIETIGNQVNEIAAGVGGLRGAIDRISTQQHLREEDRKREIREIAWEVCESAISSKDTAISSPIPATITSKLAVMMDSIRHIDVGRRDLDHATPALTQAERQIENTFPDLVSKIPNINRRHEAYQEVSQYQYVHLDNIFAVGKAIRHVTWLPELIGEEVRAAIKAIGNVDMDWEDKSYLERLRPWLCEVTWPHAYGVCPHAPKELRRQALLRFGRRTLVHIKEALVAAGEVDQALHLATEAGRAVLQSKAFARFGYDFRAPDMVEAGNSSTWFKHMNANLDPDLTAMGALLTNYGILREVRDRVDSLTRHLEMLKAVAESWNHQLTKDTFGIGLAADWDSSVAWQPYMRLSESIKLLDSQPANETIFKVLSNSRWGNISPPKGAVAMARAVHRIGPH